jgi:hypothetical protein
MLESQSDKKPGIANQNCKRLTALDLPGVLTAVAKLGRASTRSETRQPSLRALAARPAAWPALSTHRPSPSHTPISQTSGTNTMAGGASTNGTGGAPPQAGVLEGINPIKYDPANPILLFIIQASVVVYLVVSGPQCSVPGPFVSTQAENGARAPVGLPYSGQCANNSTQHRPASSSSFASCCIVRYMTRSHDGRI